METSTPKTERVRLFNRSPRGRSASGAKGLIVAGIVAILCGSPGILIALGLMNPESLHPNRELRSPIPFFAVFVLAGASIIFRGVTKLIQDPERLRRANPGWAPWMTDYPWKTDGETTSRLAAGLWGLLAAGLFLGCVVWIQWSLTPRGSGMPKMFYFMFGFLYLFVVAFFIQPIYRILQFVWYGSARISYSSFPLPLGEEITLGLEMPRGVKADRMLVTLRYIEEYEVRNTSPNRNSNVEQRIDMIYGDEAFVPVQRNPLGGIRAAASFKLPTGDYDTALAAEKPRYWEAEFAAETPGVDFSITFLLPVFAADPSNVQRLA